MGMIKFLFWLPNPLYKAEQPAQAVTEGKLVHLAISSAADLLQVLMLGFAWLQLEDQA